MGPQLLALSLFAHPPVLPGDIEPGGMTRGACTLNPYANDVIGGTDKLNSHSVSAACGSQWGIAPEVPSAEPNGRLPVANNTSEIATDIGWYSGVTWRLLTPIKKVRHGAPQLEQPIGSYADWVEWQNAIAYAWKPLYTQASVSLHHLGPKGGAAIQNGTHALFGLQSRYSWSKQRHNWSLGGSAEMGLILQWAVHRTPTLLEEVRLGVGWSDSPLLREPYATLRMHGTLVTGIIWHGALLMGRPTEGSLNLVPLASSSPLRSRNRFSVSGTLRYLRHLTSSATFSTPYVAGDQVRQLVLMPLGFVIDL